MYYQDLLIFILGEKWESSPLSTDNTHIEDSIVAGFHELFSNHLGGYLHSYLTNEVNDAWISAIVSTKIKENDQTILNKIINLVEQLGLSRREYIVTKNPFCPS